MNTTLWVLLFEDSIFIIVLGLLLYLRQHPYAIIATVIFALVLLMNVITLRGFSNALAFGITCFSTVAILLIARPFLPRTRVTLGIGMSKNLVVPSLFVFLLLMIFSVVAILFTKR